MSRAPRPPKNAFAEITKSQRSHTPREMPVWIASPRTRSLAPAPYPSDVSNCG